MCFFLIKVSLSKILQGCLFTWTALWGQTPRIPHEDFADFCWISNYGNGLHLYSTFIQSTLQFASHSHTHIHTPMTVSYRAGSWPEHREQFEVQRLVQGHLDMWAGGAGNLTTNPFYLLSHRCPMINHKMERLFQSSPTKSCLSYVWFITIT